MTNDTEWTWMHDRLHRTLRKRQLLPRNGGILVAVSGGQDSICLLKLLLDLQPKWGWRLGVAHCNHRWRSDAEANARYVENLAQNWGLPFYLKDAGANPPQGEDLARQWRYEVLAQTAEDADYSFVATGHTRSDIAETVLFNLVRGTGADGLLSIAWQKPLTESVFLVRPLLEISRQETGEFCQSQGLEIWVDHTNQNWQYSRNRIRGELLPYLAQNFNPQVEQNLARTAEILRADVEYLEQAAAELLALAIPQNSTNVKSKSKINRRVLKEAPLGLQRRAMRQWLGQALGRAPGFEHIEKLTALINASNREQTDPFPGGLIARVEGDWVVLADSGASGE
ncbi:tRNA lysidine(34) synthetase TilS [[Phormidium] sp. ETS-05]|uniref:tRNA lysidine(34) synthetase TilS n=1 Tax=[Phormidium] sp. ETS-05 TaxID=222819 RepID=UPI0035C92675